MRWIYKKKNEPLKCEWEKIKGDLVFIHRFDLGKYECRCGKMKVKKQELKGGWRGFQKKDIKDDK